HFCSYREKFIGLYCRLSAVVELDSLNTQQSLREAISDSEVAAAKQRHQQVLDFMQQIDEVWREMRWIMDALQYARYKQPASGLPITKLIDPCNEQTLKKISSTSSHIDCLPSPSPSPEMHRRKAVSESQPGSDEEGCSEVFLPTDSDYDSSDALSPRDLDLVYLSSHDIAQQALSGLSGSAPDVLQMHDDGPPRGLGLAHAASLPEERRSCLHDPRPPLGPGVYGDPYPATLVGQDSKPWASLSPNPAGRSSLPSPTSPKMSPEGPKSQVSEILSSML
uniref:Uncharacterized LOC101602066 n=1 Tax=Jaculus jaculus TaxID=51337 RepID=A0A8C5LHU2_JACJA